MKVGEFSSLEDYEYSLPRPGRFVLKKHAEPLFPTTKFIEALKRQRLKRADIARHLRCKEKEIISVVYNYQTVTPYQRTSAFLLKIFEDMQAGTFTSLEDYEPNPPLQRGVRGEFTDNSRGAVRRPGESHKLAQDGSTPSPATNSTRAGGHPGAQQPPVSPFSKGDFQEGGPDHEPNAPGPGE